VLPDGRDVGNISFVHTRGDATEACRADGVASARWHDIRGADLG
jgi:hypothetical protein